MANFPLIGHHILVALSTYIIGDSPFPEYSVVVLMDDVQLVYYDSNMKKLIYRNYKSDNEEEEQSDATFMFHQDYNSLQNKALFAQQLINISHGRHVVQRLSKCELFDETYGPVMVRDAFEGETEEEINFSNQDNIISVKTEGLWKPLWNDENRKSYYQMMYAQHYSPICIKSLKNVLYTRRNYTTKVKPSVEFFQKTLPDSGRVKVTCLATGFYPRHINLTLLRDGQPVSDHQITGGKLLPNGDETYQMRKSLEVSAEELREKHKYTCTVDHISEKRTIHLDLHCLSMVEVVLICGAVVVVLICGAGAIAYVTHRKKQRGSVQTHQRDTPEGHTRGTQQRDSPEGTEDSSSIMVEMSTIPARENTTVGTRDRLLKL